MLKYVESKKINMTSGPILGKMLVFIFPLLLTNLLQVFYNAADMIVVSMSTESDAVGAIGTTGPMINLVLNVFIGFSVGANVVVAQMIGSRDDKGISDAVHTSICMSAIFGIIGGAVGIAFARPLLSAMGNTGNLLELAVKYSIIYFAGVPFLSLSNFLIAILRAEGDTRTPLIILTGTGLLNVGLNLFFVLVIGMSVEGVAYATSISNVASSVLLMVRLSRDKSACKLVVRRLRIELRAFKKIIYVGIPAGIQGALFSFSNMLIQSSVLQINNATCPPDSAYQPVVKGNAAESNIEGFIYTATNSVHQASVTFTGQNVGAAKYERIKKIMRCCYIVTFAIAVAFSLTIYLLRAQLLGAYGIRTGAEGSLDAIAYNTAVTKIMIMIIPYFLLAFMEVGSGVLRGLGRSITSTVVSLIGSCVFRVIWILTVFRAFPTLEVIYLSYPLSWGLTAIAHFICCTVIRRRLLKKKRRIESAPTFNTV